MAGARSRTPKLRLTAPLAPPRSVNHCCAAEMPPAANMTGNRICITLSGVIWPALIKTLLMEMIPTYSRYCDAPAYAPAMLARSEMRRSFANSSSRCWECLPTILSSSPKAATVLMLLAHSDTSAPASLSWRLWRPREVAAWASTPSGRRHTAQSASRQDAARAIATPRPVDRAVCSSADTASNVKAFISGMSAASLSTSWPDVWASNQAISCLIIALKTSTESCRTSDSADFLKPQV
mmetsp:Transcript_98875/g.280019  ORF Transcript_98875/g.280019 Transcript_98875/m.280019 type:complete len:238 (+) Transcript_98875:2491-3204(+)